MNAAFQTHLAQQLAGIRSAGTFKNERVILTPQHAKSLLMALDQNLKNYESQFDPIKLPGDPRSKELGFKA